MTERTPQEKERWTFVALGVLALLALLLATLSVGEISTPQGAYKCKASAPGSLSGSAVSRVLFTRDEDGNPDTVTDAEERSYSYADRECRHKARVDLVLGLLLAIAPAVVAYRNRPRP